MISLRYSLFLLTINEMEFKFVITIVATVMIVIIMSC